MLTAAHSSLPHHHLRAGVGACIASPCSRKSALDSHAAACCCLCLCCTRHPSLQAASDFFGDQMKTAANQRARAIAAAEAGADEDAMEAEEGAGDEADTGEDTGNAGWLGFLWGTYFCGAHIPQVRGPLLSAACCGKGWAADAHQPTLGGLAGYHFAVCACRRRRGSS